MEKICKTKDMEYIEGLIENDGVKIFYREYGLKESEPILLVHGLGAQLVHWPPHLVSFLVDHGFRVITFDNRDSGLSSRFKDKPSFGLGYLRYFFRLPIKTEYSLNDMAKDGINLLEEYVNDYLSKLKRNEEFKFLKYNSQRQETAIIGIEVRTPIKNK